MFDQANLERSLGFQLKMLQIESEARARKALAPFDISPARVAAMMMIRTNPGCTQTALGDALSVNRASAMKLVNFLEGRGLVRREQGADLRANAVFLTPEGISALEKMTAALQIADAEALAPLSRKEADLLLSCIRKMRIALGHEFDGAGDEADPDDSD